jgi:hypothetical protein
VWIETREGLTELPRPLNFPDSKRDRLRMAGSPSGKAEVCKTSIAGSIPAPASTPLSGFSLAQRHGATQKNAASNGFLPGDRPLFGSLSLKSVRRGVRLTSHRTGTALKVFGVLDGPRCLRNSKSGCCTGW